MWGILPIRYKRHQITSLFSSFIGHSIVRIYINTVLTIEEDQHHSNYHINLNWSRKQCIQCYMKYSWYNIRDIRSPVCSHPLSITVYYVFICFLKGKIIYLFFIPSPPHQDTLYCIKLSSPSIISAFFFVSLPTLPHCIP